MKFLKDMFTRGFVAGFIGGISASAINFPLVSMKVAEFHLIDFAGVLIYGHFPKTIWEIGLGLLIHWGFAGFGAAVFVFLVRLIGGENFIFKSWLFGVGIWFSVYVLTQLYKIEEFRFVDFPTALSNLIASSAYGIVMGLTFKFLEKRFGNPGWK